MSGHVDRRCRLVTVAVPIACLWLVIGCHGQIGRPTATGDDAGPLSEPRDSSVDGEAVDAPAAMDGPSDGQTSDAARDDGGGDAASARAETGAGPGDAAAGGCDRDDDCASLRKGFICHDATRRCVPGTRCNRDVECQRPDPLDLCYRNGRGCLCAPEVFDDSGLFSGVCRRRRGPCEPCASDAECGPEGTPEGRCRALPGGDSAQRFCLWKRAACGSAERADDAGFCVPASGRCEEGACVSEGDCPIGATCELTTGRCERRCRWDYERRVVVGAVCPAGQTCSVDPALLGARSPLFGWGRCLPACADDASCAALDPRLVCVREIGPNDQPSPGRCRPQGACLEDRQCPAERQRDSNLPSRCDRTTFSCVYMCRTSIDPTTGLPFDDCPGGRCLTINGGSKCG